jgi:hypothetical protein
VATDTVTAAPARRRQWRTFAPAIAIYVAARAITIAVVAITDLFSHDGLVSELSRWDGQWFLLAANHGWPGQLPMVDGHVAGSQIAFFPLFPLLMRALSDVSGLSTAVAGLLISGLTGLTAVIAVGALTRVYSDESGARRAAILFALSPGSFVFSLIYNEGIVVTLMAIALWALVRRRWLLAGVLGAVATATSPVGLILVAVSAWSALRAVVRDHAWRALVAPVIAPAGFVAWTAYLWVHTGTPRAWQLTERGGWNSYPSFAYPVHVILKFVTNPISPTMTGQMLVLCTVVAVIGLVVVFREKMPSELVVYATVAVVLFAISAPVGLRPRFLMLVFPIAMAMATRYRGRTYAALASLSAIGLALMTFETFHSWAVFP